jgi:hypothetical protein
MQVGVVTSEGKIIGTKKFAQAVLDSVVTSNHGVFCATPIKSYWLDLAMIIAEPASEYPEDILLGPAYVHTAAGARRVLDATFDCIGKALPISSL